MAGEFGVSFAPTGKNDQQQDGGAASTPIQDAIKVLSLRIPQFVGARGVAPPQLLGGPGSAGVPGGSAPGAGGVPGGLDEFLRRLFGQGGMGGAMAPMGGPPTPNVVPGGGEARMPVPPPEEPIPGGIVNPGTFSPSSGQPTDRRPMMGGGRSPMHRLP